MISWSILVGDVSMSADTTLVTTNIHLDHLGSGATFSFSWAGVGAGAGAFFGASCLDCRILALLMVEVGCSLHQGYIFSCSSSFRVGAEVCELVCELVSKAISFGLPILLLRALRARLTASCGFTAGFIWCSLTGSRSSSKVRGQVLNRHLGVQIVIQSSSV